MEVPDTPIAATEDALSHLVIEGSASAAVGASGSKDPDMAPAMWTQIAAKLLGPTAAPVIKKVNWGVSTPGIEDRVALKYGERTINGNLCTAEGVDEDPVRSGDGNASVNIAVGNGDEAEGGDEAEDGDAEESSSAEEANDEEESDPDDDDSSVSEVGEISNVEVHYTEEDIQNLLNEFFVAEHEAIEAQEKLEDESLRATRLEVSLELSETKFGPELGAAVEEEMASFTEMWEEKLAELEDQIALLQEKLEEAGLDLPQLYKYLEKQLPELCTTEAWRKRTHWAGITPTSEVYEVVESAELDLKEKRPVRRHHGRIQDEGASGFLVTKVKAQTQSDDVPEDGWSLYDILDKEDNPGPGSLMGTEKWASVYLASTPEQAAQMGLLLPGIDTVEEIGDLDADKSKLFKEALASEGQQSLTGKQKVIMKKVCEEDDVKKTKKLQRKLLRPRPRKPRTHAHRKLECPTYINEASSSGAGAEVSDMCIQVSLPLEENGSLPDQVKNLKIEGDADLLEPSPPTSANSHEQDEDGKGNIGKANAEPWIVDIAGVVHPRESQGPDSQNGVVSLMSSRRPKRRLTPTEIDVDSNDTKRRKTVVMIDSDGEHEVEESLKGENHLKDSGGDFVRDSAEVVVLGSRKDSSQIVQLERLSGNWLISQGGDDHSGDELLRPNTRKRQSSSRFFQDVEPRNFSCTACGMLLKNREVMKHPSLDVGICRKCKNFLFSGPFNKDEEGHEDECRWCGQGGDVLCCETCDKVFCCPCIKRNIGEEGFNQIAVSEDWKCFFCNKQPLHNLRLQYQAVKDALKAQQADTEDDFVSDRITSNKKSKNRRRNIRPVLDDGELDEKTKHLLALEKERQERLETWRAKSKANGGGPPVKPNRYNRHVHTNDQLLDMDEDDIADEGFILNKARADNEEPVRICPHISHVLRPHQLAGMRFMWENCIESVSKVKSGVDGLGCILAHSMGLGKTLQVIGFVHTVLKKMDLSLRTVLIVVPVNVLHNWRSEFHKWQPGNEAPIPVYMLEDVARDNVKRAKLLAKWKSRGGVMLIGYTAFRNLSTGKTVKEKTVRESIFVTLQDPGPDILVCDEAHMIKNPKADITQALRQVRTHRRIALTGSPLQNNLQEYYCMVDFVREGFLGPLPEFRRRFSTPIENGQRLDSTSRDVKLMKHRAHVLHKQLLGFVQRKTMNVLKDELPSKCVYVISVRLSPLQRALYLKYLQMNGFLDNGKNEKPQSGNILFQAYHTLAKIWNHPDLLILAQEEKDLRKEDNVENFIVDKDDDVPDVVGTGHTASDGVIIINDDNGADGTVKETGPSESKSISSNGVRTVCRADGNHDDQVDKSGWWKDMMEGQGREVVEMSGKMVILMKILSLSSARSDKALVFSQSLHTLDLIEGFLESMPCLNGWKGNWKKNRDWYRLDGQTSAKSRQDLVESFNDPENTCVQCVLISTRAGSLGINLPAANRVIIFDGSWNPTHDLQALFRAWRFGQKKNVYAYRLLASGTMEEKIYNRQVAKEGLAARVLDEHQVARHFLEQDLDFLFVLDRDDDYPEDEDNSQNADLSSTLIQEEVGPVLPLVKPKRAAFSVPSDAPPRDDVMGKLLLEYRPKWIGRYHEHEPLLEDLEDEKLSKEEQSLAWESFQHEETVPQSLASSTPGVPHMLPLPTFQQNPVSIPYNLPSVQSNPLPVSHFPASNTVPSHVAKAKGCSVENHVRQLKDEEIKAGSSSFCGLCNDIISWETLRRS